MWGERSPCQPMPQLAQPPSLDSRVHPWSYRGVNSIHVAARQNYVHGKVNHVAVEEA
jgi:hypothetical protein